MYAGPGSEETSALGAKVHFADVRQMIQDRAGVLQAAPPAGGTPP